MYENVTYEVLLRRMLERIPSTLDKREGSVIWDTHSPTAIELELLYIELDALINECYGDTASREFLIRRCKERGIYVHPASRATLRGIFTPVDIEVLGKRFNIGDLNYVVVEKIADGEYKVTCETAGIVGNQNFGMMIPMDYIAGLETATLTEVLIPGEDEEDTEELRTRYFESFNDTAFGGNAKDYHNKVTAISGVGAVKIKRVWNGDIKPAQMIPNESVRTWYGSIIGSVSSEIAAWLSTVYLAAGEKKLTVGGTVRLTIIDSNYSAASPTLVDAVQTAIDPEQNAGEGLGLAPIGHVVSVASASQVAINVKTTITFSNNYSWDNLEKSIIQAIEDYLLELRKEWATNDKTVVRIAQIENHIMGISGIVDIHSTSINDSEENLTLGENEIPVIGEVGHD